MIDQEKIPYLDQEGRSRLYRISDRLLATVEIPPESFGFRLRRSAINNFPNVHTWMKMIGVATDFNPDGYAPIRYPPPTSKPVPTPPPTIGIPPLARI